MKRGRKPRPFLERFNEKMPERIPGACWIWTGGRYDSGYGIFKALGKNLRAHRVSYQIHVGPIPPGMLVCHSCDNPPCVNPAHLFLGTDQQNVADRTRKGRGRTAYGSKHPNAKITEAQADNIKALRISKHLTLRELSYIFPLSQASISRIIQGKRWKNVPQDYRARIAKAHSP